MLSIKSLATPAAVNGWRRGTKWAYLEYLSTITKIALAELDRGRPSMKSIEITSHVAVGTGMGWSSPG
jgi:hypothetical protein